MITKRRFLSVAWAGGMTAVAPGLWHQAQSQAVRPSARLVVGFPPGGSVDVVARLLAGEMKSYASTFIVENRPGAGGRVALDGLKASPADGSALALAPASPIVIFPHVYKRLNYDPLQDFIAVTTVCAFPFLLAVGPMVPRRVKTLADFIQWCRDNPRQATYGSSGAGSLPHFIGVSLARAAGFEFVHLPYQGGAPAMQDLLGGQISASVSVFANAFPHIQSGSLRALVTTGPQRSALLPDVPTVREAGYPALEVVEWFGVFVPAKTPADVVDSLGTAIREALRTNEVKAGLARLSFEPAGASPGDFARLVRSDTERWGSIVKASGFTPID